MHSFENYETAELMSRQQSSVWNDIAAQCYGTAFDRPTARTDKSEETEEFEFVSTLAPAADDPVKAALEILATASVRKDGTKVKATLPEKTYLDVNQPGLKQLYFAKELSMSVSIEENRIKLSNITGLQGRPPLAPKIGGWVSIKDIEVDPKEARIVVGKLGARFTVKIPIDESAFAEIKTLLKKYDIR